MKLKRCPFRHRGSHIEFVYLPDEEQGFMRCEDCGAEGPTAQGPREMAKKDAEWLWNSRAEGKEK